MQILEKRTETSELNTKNEILNAFNQRLYTPNELLKPMIIERLTEYLLEKLKDERYRLKIFSVNSGDEVLGVVVAMVHPTYTSYTRKCGTFGWLNCVNDFDVCKTLIESCEDFMRANKVRKMRGNINFPKGLGGMGIQTSGFDQQMMYGISFDDPYSEKASYLRKLGYAAESEYICMYVTDERWDSAKKVDADIRLGFLSLDEMYERIDEFHELVRKSFQGSLPMPDSSGSYRLEEMFETYAQVNDAHYLLNEELDLDEFSEDPTYQEAWTTCDLEKVVTFCPLAFDRKTDKIVGAILGLPDLYQQWLGRPITRENVDTVMVDKDYAGKGVFSALNNLGQMTGNMDGVTYYEGTYIWNNNPDAVKAILPHGVPVRIHNIFQKRIKSKK